MKMDEGQIKGIIENEIKRLRSYSADTVAYYDIQEFKLIRPD